MANSVLTKIIPDGPYTSAATVTPSNSADLAFNTRAIWVGAAGSNNLKVDMVDGQTVAMVGVTVGWHRICVSRIYSSGTDVSSIVAFW